MNFDGMERAVESEDIEPILQSATQLFHKPVLIATRTKLGHKAKPWIRISFPEALVVGN